MQLYANKNKNMQIYKKNMTWKTARFLCDFEQKYAYIKKIILLDFEKIFKYEILLKNIIIDLKPKRQTYERRTLRVG